MKLLSSISVGAETMIRQGSDGRFAFALPAGAEQVGPHGRAEQCDRLLGHAAVACTSTAWKGSR